MERKRGTLLKRLAERKGVVSKRLEQEGFDPSTGGSAKSSLLRRGPVPAFRSEAPLSFQQERLWLLDRLQPSAAWNVVSHLKITGPLDAGMLGRALRTIVERHEILRTVVNGHAEPPVQMVSDRLVEAALVTTDVLTDQRSDDVLHNAIVEEKSLRFDLEKGPLMRARLVRLAPESHSLLLVMHHIVSDGWSKGVLGREVAALYDAFSQGQPSPLPDLAVQYTDYATWQRELLKGEFIEHQLRYWAGRLEGAPEVTTLPADFRRPVRASHAGSLESAVISNELLDALNALARRYQATLFSTLFSAFNVLLHRYSGATDLVVGTPIANRPHSYLEPMIGYFANAVALRTKLEGNPRFDHVLGRVTAEALDAYGHQDVPLELVIKRLGIGHDFSRNSLFQVMFILHNEPSHSFDSGSLRIEQLEIDGGFSKFDVTLSIRPTARGLELECEYSTELFERDTIRRLLQHYLNLLREVTRDPSTRVGDIRILKDSEISAQLDWSNVRSRYANEPVGLVHRLFEQRAAETPDAIAACQGDERITYHELNQRADALARTIRETLRR